MRAVYLAVALVLCLGCEPDFPKPERIDGYRVLGVISNPPAIGPTDAVTLSLIEANAQDASYEWSVCLVSLGSAFGFQCVDPALDLPLDIDGASATVSLDSDGIDFFTTLLNGLAGLTDENEGQLGEDDDIDCGDACKSQNGEEQTYLDIQFRIKSGIPNGREVETIKLVRVHFDDGPRNRNPAFETFEFSQRIEIPQSDNDPIRFEKLSFSIDSTLTDEYTLANGVVSTEEPRINWYSTAGTFYKKAEKDADEQAVSLASAEEVYLKLPDPATVSQITVWGVLRDGRGGLDARSLVLDLTE